VGFEGEGDFELNVFYKVYSVLERPRHSCQQLSIGGIG